MKLLRKMAEEIQRLMESYNEVMEEDKQIDIAIFIQEAIDNALNGDQTDWKELQHLKYLEKSFQIIKVYPDKEIYKALMQKAQGMDGITFDDIMNFVVKNYLVLFKIKVKKAIIDQHWDVERVILALHKYGLTINLKQNGEPVSVDCPCCGHEDFAIFPNTRIVYCHRGSCKYHCGNYDIWEMLQDSNKSMGAIVEELYDELIVNYDSNVKKIEDIDFTIKRQHGYYNNAIDKILPCLTQDFDYMYNQGYQRAELIGCDIGYMGADEVPNCNEANDFRHRMCFVIKDIDGKAVGIQGRSIYDDEDERRNLVRNDSIWKRLYWSKPEWDDAIIMKKNSKKRKLNEKLINTSGFEKSQHLFLLYKYAKMPEEQKPKMVVVVEGAKDAIRVYGQNIPGVAVVASFGCELHTEQINLLKKVFDVNTRIIMAYDADEAGTIGNIKAAKALRQAGFINIRFCLYKSDDNVSYYKDFGEINTREHNYKIISSIIDGSISEAEYKLEMIRRGIQIGVDEGDKRKVSTEQDDIIEFTELYGRIQPIMPNLQKKAQMIFNDPVKPAGDKVKELEGLRRKGLLVDMVFINEMIKQLSKPSQPIG